MILTTRTAGTCLEAGTPGWTVLSLTAEFLAVDDTMIDLAMMSDDAMLLGRVAWWSCGDMEYCGAIVNTTVNLPSF